MFKEIGDELADFIGWFKDHLADTDVRREIAQDLGLEPGESVPDANLPQDKLDSIERYRSQANPDREAFFILLKDVRAVWEAVGDFVRSLGVGGVTTINQAVNLVFDTLALNYFRLRHPQIYFGAQLLEALAADSAEIDESDAIVERMFRSILWHALGFLLSPIGYLYQSFVFGVEDEAAARKASERIFTHLAAFLVMAKSIDAIEPLFTSEVILGWDSLIKADASPADQKTPKADEISERMLSFALVHREKDKASGKEIKTAISFSLAVVPESHGANGLFIGMGGSGLFETKLTEKWKSRAEFSSPSSAAFLIQKDRVNDKWLFSADGPNEARAVLSLITTPDPSGITYTLPDGDGTRVELGKLSFSIVLAPGKTELKVSAKDCALIIATKDNDDFIASLLPDDGIRIPINFGMGYSEAKGFFTEGNIPFLSGSSTETDDETKNVVSPNLAKSAVTAEPPPLPTLSAGQAPQLGLVQLIPVDKSLGPVKIKQLLLGVFPTDDPASPTVEAEVSTSLEVSFGPVLATVDRVGFRFKLGFPESGGNMGFADLDLGLKPPLGAGLKVNTSIVTGGGFLAFDSKRGQYAGVVELAIRERISIKGIGLIATRLPDNRPGFSLLIIISAENLDIPLGFGFRLTAIGGLLAINRTFDEEALRTGLKNRTLDSVLFPKDPISNAPQLLSNLNKVFPPAAGHHLFGPVARIEWGTPALITADLALVLELGTRHRLLLLAQIAVILPKPENDLIRLQMDAIGVFDFDEGVVALDAVLYDSRLLKKFVLTGAMAMRLNVGSSPNFALAIGGLHPAFNPPPNFPKLERIAINLTAGDNPRFRCEAYFALTANTVQFGARAELLASARGFSIHGEVGFDVLIQFSPFQFLAEFFAQVQVKRGSTNLFKVRVEGALAGPKPLHIKAKATFEILRFDVSVRIDKTLFAGEKPPLPEPVDVLPQLRQALSLPGNWVGRLPANQSQMVTLRSRADQPGQAATNEVLIHPLSVLTVKQGVVPLDMDISRFGQTTPAGARRFTIDKVSLGGQDQTTKKAVRDFFAPAQFFEMSDAEKLSRPSFDQMAAGVEIGTHEIVFDRRDCVPLNSIEFETKIYDREKGKSRPGDPQDPADQNKRVFHALSPDLLLQQAGFGAAGSSDLRRSGSAKYRTTVGKYEVKKEGWSIVATDDLTVRPAPGAVEGRAMSYSEAEQALERLQQEDPASAGRLKIMRFQSEVQTWQRG